MDEICITGGKPLQGKISVQESKNAALPMMAAALLHRGIKRSGRLSGHSRCILYGRNPSQIRGSDLVG